MTEQIHVLINGEEYGPYSDAEFRQYLAEQNIISHDLVWTDPLAQWMTVEEFLKKPKPEPTPKVPSKLPTPSDGREATDLFYRGINLSLGDNVVSADLKSSSRSRNQSPRQRSRRSCQRQAMVGRRQIYFTVG